VLLLLELARGIAALWVVIFHLRSYFGDPTSVVHLVAEFGYLGVPMFFVISGYVITHSAEANRRRGGSPREFLKNRFRRIYPAFWASILIAIAVPFLIESLSYLKSGNYQNPLDTFADYSPVDWINLTLLTKVFSAKSFDLFKEFNTVNAVYWSLAIEFQFYIVIFFALYLKKYYRLCIGLVSVASVIVMYLPYHLNYGLFIHFWPSFAVGILLAYLHKRGVYFTAASTAKAIGLFGTFLLCWYLLQVALPEHFNKLSLLFACGFGGLLWFIAGAEKWLQKVKAGHSRIPAWLLQPWLILGAMSYSVYLLHLEVMPLCEMLLRQVTRYHGMIVAIAIILMILGLCYPFYYYVERRFLSSNYKRLHEKITGH
jgi:peptidoglycan/LPS O-acetylase OafA/YrhL